MEHVDMDGVQGYIDENGNLVYVDGDMMGSEEEYGGEIGDMNGDSYG